MAAVSFDPKMDYQAQINKLKAINPTDPNIALYEQQRIAKIASNPTGLMKYAQDPNAVYGYMAGNALEPQHNQNDLTMTQQVDRLKAAQESQKAGLDNSYDYNVQTTEKGYDTAKQNAENDALARGMARSSYASDRTARLDTEQVQAITQINNQRTQAIDNINSNITMLDNQLADSLSQGDMDLSSQVAAQIDKLRSYYDEIARSDAASAEQTRQFNAQNAEQTRQSNAASAEQTRQSNAASAEQKRQFDLSYGLDKRQVDYALNKPYYAPSSGSGSGGGSSGGGSASSGGSSSTGTLYADMAKSINPFLYLNQNYKKYGLTSGQISNIYEDYLINGSGGSPQKTSDASTVSNEIASAVMDMGDEKRIVVKSKTMLEKAYSEGRISYEDAVKIGKQYGLAL